jgi:hypothetical protein
MEVSFNESGVPLLVLFLYQLFCVGSSLLARKGQEGWGKGKSQRKRREKGRRKERKLKRREESERKMTKKKEGDLERV